MNKNLPAVFMKVEGFTLPGNVLGEIGLKLINNVLNLRSFNLPDLLHVHMKKNGPLRGNYGKRETRGHDSLVDDDLRRAVIHTLNLNNEIPLHALCIFYQRFHSIFHLWSVP